MAPHATTPAELIARARAGEKCERCYGRGEVAAYCGECGDSTWDHECPPDEVCPECKGSGRTVGPLVAELATALEQLLQERDEAREELKAARYVGQLAARDRDNALAERNRWQDKACELQNELATLRAAVRTYLDQPDGWARQPAYQALRALLPPEAPEAPAPGEPPSEPRPVYKAPAEGDW